MPPKFNVMLSIFQKKTYLVDLLEGVIDFHNHVLPGIDDGAQNIEESTQLIDQFRELGINRIVATPHVMGDFYPNTPESIKEALESLNSSLNNDFQISASAEYMMDQHFLEILKSNKILPIVRQNILVEMSFFQQPINLHEILFSIQNHSFNPILAHPERYAYLHSKDLSDYADLKSRGCSFQLNMLSLAGHYGEGVQKISFKLLEEGLIDYICSDVHKIDHIEKVKRIRITNKYSEKLTKVIENNKILFRDH